MQISTRTLQQDVGVLLKFNENGAIVSQSHVAREVGIPIRTAPGSQQVQVGTTVSLTNLFASLPVRFKEFQRNIKKVGCRVSHIVLNAAW